MKKAILILSVLLFALLLFFPLLAVLCACLALQPDLTRPLVLTVPTALCALTLLLLARKAGSVNKGPAVLLALAGPLSVVNACWIAWTVMNRLTTLLLLLIVVCCLLAFFRCGWPKALKTVGICFLLVYIPLYILFPLSLGHYGERTVEQNLTSPCGAYYAEREHTRFPGNGGVIDVYICQDRLDAGFFKLRRSERIEHDRYSFNGEPDPFQLQWEDDSGLLIDGISYANPFVEPPAQ